MRLSPIETIVATATIALASFSVGAATMKHSLDRWYAAHPAHAAVQQAKIDEGMVPCTLIQGSSAYLCDNRAITFPVEDKQQGSDNISGVCDTYVDGHHKYIPCTDIIRAAPRKKAGKRVKPLTKEEWDGPESSGYAFAIRNCPAVPPVDAEKPVPTCGYATYACQFGCVNLSVPNNSPCPPASPESTPQ